MGKKGLSSLLFKLRDNPRPSSSSSSSFSSSSSSSSSSYNYKYYFCYPPPPSSWPWPSSCKDPKTNSFRAHAHASASSSFYKTANSVYDNSAYSVASPTSDDTESLLPGSTRQAPVPVRVRSDRLLFEPGATTRSIVHARRNIHNNNNKNNENNNANNIDNITKKREEKEEEEKEEEGKVNDDLAGAPFEESVALTVESTDPYSDFRASMEEMVVAHAVSDWDGFEELLAWYLQANGKNTHGFIVGAFVDLLASFASASASATATATASASGSDSDSNSSSSTLSSTIPFDHDIEKGNVVACRE